MSISKTQRFPVQITQVSLELPRLITRETVDGNSIIPVSHKRRKFQLRTVIALEPGGLHVQKGSLDKEDGRNLRAYWVISGVIA